MTKDEKQAFEKLMETVSELRRSNAELANDLRATVVKLNEKVDRKHEPFSLEANITSSVQAATAKAIDQVLTSYDSPLNKLVAIVVDEHAESIKQLANNALRDVLADQAFADNLRAAFAGKVARGLIAGEESLLTSVTRELRSDQRFKAQLTSAVANLVDSYAR